jgi:vanillate monooxygenase ferredoxin subunit
MNELLVKVISKTNETEDICRIELGSIDGAALPTFTAGAHIDVHVSPDVVRQYSLCNITSSSGTYVIGVLREPASRGGSLAMHALQPQQEIRISMPRNHFPLKTGRKSYLFAGGIGITPMLSMAAELAAAGADFELHYCVRSTQKAAFLAELESDRLCQHCQLHCDDGPAKGKLDLPKVLSEPNAQDHVYVCGPSGFIDFVLGAARSQGWAAANLHREYFNAVPVADAPSGSFKVRLVSTGQIFDIGPEESVANVLADHEIEIPMSCEQGVCGTCVTKVLDGVPDHRDFFLTDEEREKNDCFTPCCSRSFTPLLVLDL